MGFHLQWLKYLDQNSPPNTGNCEISFSSDCRVWRINDNAGKLFEGALVTTNEPVLNNQWILSDYISSVSEDQPQLEQIAIAASKTTDVLRFRPLSISQGLNLDPVNSKGGVKAAIYSASFLLRASVGEILDIDPEEIEICNFQRSEINGTGIGNIALSDRLANGSGFVRYISDNWEQILHDILSPHANSFSGKVISVPHRIRWCGRRRVRSSGVRSRPPAICCAEAGAARLEEVVHDHPAGGRDPQAALPQRPQNRFRAVELEGGACGLEGQTRTRSVTHNCERGQRPDQSRVQDRELLVGRRHLIRAAGSPGGDQTSRDHDHESRRPPAARRRSGRRRCGAPGAGAGQPPAEITARPTAVRVAASRG